MNNRTETAFFEKKNKRRASRAMWAVSLLLIAVTLLAEAFSIGSALLVSKYGDKIQRLTVFLLTLFGAEKQNAYAAAKYVLGTTAFAYVLNLLVTFVSLAVPAFVFSKLVKVGWDESFNLKGKTIKAFVPVYCLCHLLTSVSSVFSGAVSDFMLPGNAEMYEAYTGVAAHSFDIYEFIITVLCTVVFVPIVEEYVFRGVIYSYLKRFGISFGVIASAVVFGVAHTSPTQSVYAFVFGLVSALVFEVTGNIKTSIVFHGINNFITVCLGYILGEVSAGVFNVISSTYLLTFSGFGIYGVYVLCKKGGIIDAFKEKEMQNDGGLCEKPGLSQIVVLPFVVYLCYYVYSVVTTVM